MTAGAADRVEAAVEALRVELGRDAEGIARAPGRVNLIGEHLDYNDGFVLPFAIDRAVDVAWARRDDDAVWAYSADFGEHSRFNLSNITAAASGSWANYVRGVADALVKAGLTASGLDLAIAGDVPTGAGLSSSAAIEVAVAGAFRDACGLPLSDVDLARLCQRAENEFVGVQSGIMDQFASTLCRRDEALLIDCRSLGHESIPLRLEAGGYTIVVVNSGQRRELVASAFNARRRECEQAVVELQLLLDRPALRSLRDITGAEFARIDVGVDDVPLRRARHVVSEIQRVGAFVDAVRRGAFDDAGSLMVESHISLRDDFEVSSPALDLLVGLACAQDYVAGARLTGAGFGGCTVNLVRSDALGAFEREVIDVYRQRTGLAAELYVIPPSDGLRTWRR